MPAREQIEANAQEFIRQVGRVLHSDPSVFEVRRNSEWYDAMSVDEFLSLVGMVTHSRLVQRDMFQRRIAKGDEIYMHEMLYPVLQGYDSRMLGSDVTIVGSDQLFNELMGRTYQEKLGQEPQVVITTRITPGTDGVAKQSKSLGNYIALAETPRDMFGKAMSIPDHLTTSYLEVYTDVPMAEVAGAGRSVPCQEATGHRAGPPLLRRPAGGGRGRLLGRDVRRAAHPERPPGGGSLPARLAARSHPRLRPGPDAQRHPPAGEGGRHRARRPAD